MYRAAIKNTWTVEEVDFSTDVGDLQRKMTRRRAPPVQRLVAFFATGDSIVANNLVLNLYKHINAPEARHVPVAPALRGGAARAVLPDAARHLRARPRRARSAAFAAVENIPSIQQKAEFCFALDRLDRRRCDAARDARRTARQFLLNLICFAACIEGLFFFGAFAYVYFLRSRGLLHGLAARHELGVPRRERAHGVRLRGRRHRPRARSPSCSTPSSQQQVATMLDEAVDVRDAVRRGPARRRRRRAVDRRHARSYLEYFADQRLATLGLPQPVTASKNPFAFMELQDVQELTNFFERRVSAYQVGVTGEVTFDDAF